MGRYRTISSETGCSFCSSPSILTQGLLDLVAVASDAGLIKDGDGSWFGSSIKTLSCFSSPSSCCCCRSTRQGGLLRFCRVFDDELMLCAKIFVSRPAGEKSASCLVCGCSLLDVPANWPLYGRPGRPRNLMENFSQVNRNCPTGKSINNVILMSLILVNEIYLSV